MSRYKYHVDKTLPKADEIFVFGSNLSGIHGLGAAQVARFQFQAELGIGRGRTGNAYAIPTKGLVKFRRFPVLSLKEIHDYVREFREYTKAHKDETYFITRLACGLAAYEDSEIAPMFRGATRRCNFPKEWKRYLE